MTEITGPGIGWEGCSAFLYKNKEKRSSRRGAVETNLARNREVAGLIPGLAPWVKDPELP